MQRWLWIPFLHLCWVWNIHQILGGLKWLIAGWELSCFKNQLYHLKLVWLVVDNRLFAGPWWSTGTNLDQLETSYNFKLYFPIRKDGNPSCLDDRLHNLMNSFLSIWLFGTFGRSTVTEVLHNSHIMNVFSRRVA